MKHKAFRVWEWHPEPHRFAAGGSQYDGLNLVVQQIRAIGARQWLGLMAGSIVGSAPAIAPLTERIARSLPRRAGPAAESGTSTGQGHWSSLA